MRQLMVLVIAGVALGSLSQPSLAADMPIKAPAVAVISAYDWSGFYIGANIGGGRSSANYTNLDNTTLFGDSVPPDTFNHSLSGVFGGGQIGYNIQRGRWVFGVEALIDAAGIKGNYTSTFGAADDQYETRISTLVLLTGRIGYAWDRLLVYGKAGLGAANIEASVTDSVGPSTGSGNASDWRYGPTVGLGIEYALSPNLSVAVEYDYLNLTGTDYQLGDSTGSYLWNVEVRDVSLLMAKLNYRFSLAR